MLLDTVARLLTCKTTLPMVAYSSRPAHPAPRPRAGGAAPAAVRSGRREEFCCGRAKGGPAWDRPAGNLMCALRQNLKPRHSPGPIDTSAIVANFTPVSATCQQFLFICRVRT